MSDVQANGSENLLTADWSNIAVMNFNVSPNVTTPYLPDGLELARFGDRYLLSVVGFQFANTRIGTVSVPFYGRFTEVYLGFFARRVAGGEKRRGWVFVRKIVPSRVVATAGRLLYNEDYVRRPMRENVVPCDRSSQDKCAVEYRWLNRGRWNGMKILADPDRGGAVSPDSIEAFFCRNYGGFAKKRGGGSIEFPVTHPEWTIWPSTESVFDCDVESLFGYQFVEPLSAPAHSAFVASGSSVTLGQASSF